MIRYHDHPVALHNGRPQPVDKADAAAREKTIAYSILRAHNLSGDPEKLRLRFDALVSHDITYVGIIQTARASGLTEFPVPYAMTNCHNSLCAVGGTINEDDHVFGLSAAKKYGGIYVPANLSVIHSYAREELAGCGRMILGSDSHTRYGALGTLAIGEGGPELVKQLLKNTYDIPAPEVVLCYVTGKPRRGVGPHDVALALVKEAFPQGRAKNKILEFVGPGIRHLSADYRNGVDVMTTETTCLSSIWETDGETAEYFRAHGRPDAFQKLSPKNGAYYDAMITIELDKVECMIALPFHPSNAYPIREFVERADELLAKVEEEAKASFPKVSLDLRSKVRPDGVYADQGIIAGCAGGLFDNIIEASEILGGGSTGNGAFSLSVYPTSVPVSLALTRAEATETLVRAGAVMKPSFCGPCFGAGDVPANNGFSVRHTTRNFPNREGSKPGEGQLAYVALMDARSIAATAANGGRITPAMDVVYRKRRIRYRYDRSAYEKRCYNGYGKADPSVELVFGPNIADWPKIYPLTDNVLVELSAVIRDPVTTTDELIPSGETSSYRSNPLRLAEFTLSRRAPDYVGRSKTVAAAEAARRDGNAPDALKDLLRRVGDVDRLLQTTAYGSCVFANKPGDGSAREQAASSQRVLGGAANICYEYATKRYRSNCINWGILPFTLPEGAPFDYAVGDHVFVPNVRKAIEDKQAALPATVIRQGGETEEITLNLPPLTDDEREILLEGCLMNYYAAQAKKA
ncbi:MAG: hydratase [Clostridiales bacterium]|nr:hydratase [Clostridiales bacterium]